MKSKRIKIISDLLKYTDGMRLYLLLNCFICLVYELLPIVNMFLISYMTGALLSGMDINYGFFVLILLISVFIHSTFGYLNMWTEHDIAYRLLYKMRYEIYQRLEKVIPSFSNRMMSSEMASIASNDMNLIEWFYAHKCFCGFNNSLRNIIKLFCFPPPSLCLKCFYLDYFIPLLSSHF